MATTCVSLEVPRRNQAVNLGWLLLMPGLGPLSKKYRGYELTGVDCCLFERIRKV